jgi:phosphatidylglycerophosphate synthase
MRSITARLVALAAVVPNAVTCLGHALTLAWLLGAPWWIGAVGLACDAFDGLLARRLWVTSEYGALYDWTVDTTVCAVVLERLGVLPLLLAVVPLQVELHRRGAHLSGRAAASIALGLMQLRGPL